MPTARRASGASSRAWGGSPSGRSTVAMLTSPPAHGPSPLDFDVAILGDSGDNEIVFIGTNAAGGTSTFGPADSVIIDGNGGTMGVVGDFPVEVVNRRRRRRRTEAPAGACRRVGHSQPTPPAALAPSTGAEDGRGEPLAPR